MGITLTDVLLFGKAQSSDVDSAAFAIMRRNILRWGAIGGYVSIIVHGVSPLVLPDAIANSLSYVKAFGGTRQGLPAGYDPVNFIYFLDGAYLLTNLVPTYDCKIEMDFATTNVSSSAVTYLGARDSSSGNEGIRLSHISSGVFRVYGFGSTKDSTSTAQSNTRYKFVWNNQNAIISSGGVEIFNKTYTDTGTNTTPVAINGWNSGGTISGNTEGIYLYSFKMWNPQGQLIANYVPCVQTNPLTVGLYDLVSNTFISAPTSGTWAAGPAAGATVSPTPDAPIDIVCNNGALRYRDTELPVGYRRILGMTMNNNCYYEITGFKMNGSDTLRFSFTRTGANACNVLGAYDGTSAQTNYSLYAAATNSAYLRYNGGTYNSYAIADKKYNVVLTPTGSDGMETDSTWAAKTFTSTTNLCIGTTSPSATSSKMVGSIHGSVVVDGRLELIPCERVSDSEIGYYDPSTGTFYEPIGTTPTSLGYDYTKYDIVADGTVETIKLLYNHWDMTKASYTVPGFGAPSVSVAQDGTFSVTNISGSSGSRVQLTLSASVLGLINGQKYTLKVFILDGNAFKGACLIYHGSSYRQYSCDGTQTTLVDSWTQSADAEIKVGMLYFKDYAVGTIVRLRVMVVAGETEPDTYEPYIDNTATAEMLLSIGNYTDEQEVISGAVTRKVGVKVFDGTENWTVASNTDASGNKVFYINLADKLVGNNRPMLCTHYEYKGSASYATLLTNQFLSNASNTSVYFDGGSITTKADWQQWLADQYAAGTPVIIIYPLATPTTETVAGQPMATTQGDNVAEITQASLTGLELEAQYSAAVSLTIEEVEDAQLSPDVEVTIQ